MEENNKKTKYCLKVQSKVHPDIHHLIYIDLRCYEKMPKENEFDRKEKKLNKKS